MQARYLHLENIAPDAIEKVEIPPGVPMNNRFNKELELVGREWLE